jgi:DNA-binding LacI/PurR family transcriptional regulator
VFLLLLWRKRANPKGQMASQKRKPSAKTGAVTLRAVAERCGLTPGTVSAVLNDTPAARAIPEHTKNRVHQAARELNYRPNFFARSLRKKRTYTIGVIAEEIGEPYGAAVISGIEAYLREHDYFFLTVIHRHDLTLLERYAAMLVERGVEGFIVVDTLLDRPLSLPTVAVAGHRTLDGVTNIVLDHEQAISAALEHLLHLGHRELAVLRGHPASADSDVRWQAICEVAARLGMRINDDLVATINMAEASPEQGYPTTCELLDRQKPFTALFAYNDLAALGAIRALQERGLRVPEDVSVVGFDDIYSAAFNTPSLTTVRQPLRKMGEIAAETLLQRIEGKPDVPSEIAVEPVLVVRESTGRAKA